MNSELKSAWFSVVIVSVAALSSLVVGVMHGWPVAFAPLALLGFLGLTPMLFGNGAGDCDERDVDVARKASLMGGSSSYVAFVFGCMTVWVVHHFRGDEAISIHFLPGLVAFGWIVFALVRSVFIISQYTPRALGSNE